MVGEAPGDVWPFDKSNPANHARMMIVGQMGFTQTKEWSGANNGIASKIFVLVPNFDGFLSGLTLTKPVQRPVFCHWS
jgi:hypothetical protein